MPSTPEIEQKLAAQQEAKKHGQPLAFGRDDTDTYRGGPERPRQTVNMAQDLVAAESVFGQQMVALEANIRALLGTMRQLQQARLRAFGADLDVHDARQDIERELERRAKKVGIGPDGFITIPKE